MSLAWVPLSPTICSDMASHLGIEIDHRRVRPPWTAQKYRTGYILVGRQPTVIEHKAGILVWIVLCLCGDESAMMRRTV